MRKTMSGFTLVELLIVIVVIGILAAITLVAYNGVQAKARDSQRQSDVAAIEKALELYYIQNGSYPSCVGAGGTTINTSWCTTADNSWSFLANILVPQYISTLPSDPVSTPSVNIQGGNGYNYAYFAGNYCGTTGNQTYILLYRLEANSQVSRLDSCPPTTLGPYGSGAISNYRVVKN